MLQGLISFVISLLLVSASFASERGIVVDPPKIDLKKQEIKKNIAIYPREVPLGRTEAALAMPFRNRLDVVLKQGPRGYKNLQFIAFNKKSSMEARWRALTLMARIGKELAMPEVEKALVSEQWFMRSAAIHSLSRIDKSKALLWAKQLLMNDSSLLVRAAATKVIGQHRDASSTAILWQRLDDKKNFHRGQGLFIRRKIVEALSKVTRPEESMRFLRVLNDKDPKVQEAGVTALEQINKVRLGKVKEPTSFKVSYWKNWLKTNF